MVVAIFLVTIFSPFAQPDSEFTGIPQENSSLVDPRLSLVFDDPSRAEELGLSPAPVGKISLIAQVDKLNIIHSDFIENLGGEITSSFSRFDAIGFLLPLEKVPEVTYLPGLTWLEADVLFYPTLDNSIDTIGTNVIWNQFGFKGEDTT